MFINFFVREVYLRAFGDDEREIVGTCCSGVGP